jgi:choline-glycine betaine transporter
MNFGKVKRIIKIALDVVFIICILIVILLSIAEHGLVGCLLFPFGKMEWKTHLEFVNIIGELILWFACLFAALYGILLVIWNIYEYLFYKNKQPAEPVAVEAPENAETDQHEHPYNTRSKARANKNE